MVPGVNLGQLPGGNCAALEPTLASRIAGLTSAFAGSALPRGPPLDPQNVGLGVFAAQRVLKRIELSGTAFSHMRVVWSRACRVVPNWSPDRGKPQTSESEARACFMPSWSGSSCRWGCGGCVVMGCRLGGGAARYRLLPRRVVR